MIDSIIYGLALIGSIACAFAAYVLADIFRLWWDIKVRNREKYKSR